MALHITTKVVYLMILASFTVFQVSSLSKMRSNSYFTLWSVVSLKNFMIKFSFILTQHKDTSTFIGAKHNYVATTKQCSNLVTIIIVDIKGYYKIKYG